LTSYLIRRLGASIIVVVGITLFTFGLLHAIFPSPAIVVLGSRANRVLIAAWNKQHGFDKPWLVQYWNYIWALLHGNLGYSWKLNQSVASLFAERWLRSMFLSGSALVLAIVISFPLGIFQAVKRNSIGDYTLTSAAFVTYAMPSFFLGIILIQIFAFSIPIFGFEASQDPSMWGIITDFHDMTLPIATLALVQLAAYSRYMRSQAMDTLAQDYIKSARAKGLPERLVLWRHLLRNASLPMVTLIGLSIPLLLAGNLVTEAVFNYPGMGLLFINSLTTEDYNTLLGYTLIAAILTVVGNLVADIALTVADPRIRLA
jgi:peptide/nickel transport system permease protein